MYATRTAPKQGLGFDWGSLIKAGGNIVGSIVGGQTPSTVPSGYSVVPASTAQNIGGMSMGTIVLLGVGGFLLYKAMQKR